MALPTYILVTPVERGLVPELLASVRAQEIAATRWVLVDGTGDPEVARELDGVAAQVPSARVLRLGGPALGAGADSVALAEGLRVALDLLEGEALDCAYVAHVRGDVAMDGAAMAELMVRLESDRTLGMVGAVLAPGATRCMVPQTLDPETPGGWIRMWRRECLAQVDFAPAPAWAEVTAAQARVAGWGMCEVPQAIARVVAAGSPRTVDCLRACAALGRAAWCFGRSAVGVPMHLKGWRRLVAQAAVLAGYTRAALARVPRRRVPALRAARI